VASDRARTTLHRGTGHTATANHAGPSCDPVAGDRTDAEIIAASLIDGEEFSAVFERYHQDIFRYVARRLGRQAADDVTADVFVAAFGRRDRYDLDVPRCRPWLYGIASNLVRDHLRRAKRRSRAYLHAAVLEPHADLTDLDTEERAAVAAAIPRINQALGRLSVADRETLLLVSLGELTYEEAAIALGLPIGTVRSRLWRARRRMQELLPDLRQTTDDVDSSEDQP
jgi:RNA polymerase sigma factor (sigma-70 family)